MYPFRDRQRAEEVCIKLKKTKKTKKLNYGELRWIPSGDMLIVMVVNRDHLFWNHY